MIIGEQSPKLLAIARAETVMLRVARPLNFFRTVFHPLIVSANAPSNFIVSRLFRVDVKGLEEETSPEELRLLINRGAQLGRLDQGEAVMLGGVFHLHEQQAREVMTPIPAVVTVDASDDVETALRRCVTSGHTRLVVIEDDNPDRVKGIVHNNSLARIYMSDGPDAALEPAIRDAPIVPETRPLDDLLQDLQRQRTSLSIVVDEYGRTVGLVTIEDILEEVVGEIEDETDPRAADLRRLTNGDWFVRGHVSARRPQGRRDRAAGRHRRLQLGGRLCLRRARPAAEARRRDHRRWLHDPGRVGPREPDRGGADLLQVAPRTLWNRGAGSSGRKCPQIGRIRPLDRGLGGDSVRGADYFARPT